MGVSPSRLRVNCQSDERVDEFANARANHDVDKSTVRVGHDQAKWIIFIQLMISYPMYYNLSVLVEFLTSNLHGSASTIYTHTSM